MLIHQLEKGALARIYFKEEYGEDFCEHGGYVLEQYYTSAEDCIDAMKPIEEYIEDVVVMTPEDVFSLSEITAIIKQYEELMEEQEKPKRKRRRK